MTTNFYEELLSLLSSIDSSVGGLGTTTNSTVTSVSASASDTTLLASNSDRKGAIIYNNSSAILYVLLASGTSSSTNFSFLLNQGESLVIDSNCLYTGIIKGIWTSAIGSAEITEFS